MTDNDYQSLQDLQNSNWWKVLTEELDKRIKAIEKVLLEPTDSDMFSNIEDEKQKNLINYKKMERKYLIWLKELPKTLLGTKINLDKKD
jgi:hypothetical protein